MLSHLNMWLTRRGRLGLVLLAVMAFLSCSQQSGHQLPQTAVIGLSSDFDTLLELGTANADALHVIEEMLFLTLCELDSSLAMQPRLARTWETSAAGREVTFHLRDDVYWSDGQPTTAEDVIFTHQLAVNPATAYTGRDRFAEVDSVAALDAYTVRFTFKRAYPDAMLDIQIPILPKHVLASVPPAELRRASFNRMPVSNGPFLLQEWRPNDRIIFAANPRYYGGKPKLDHIVFRIVPEENTLVANLQAGEIDLLPYVSANKLGELSQQPQLRVLTYPDRGYSFLAFNLQRPIFQEVAVRQAITQAINRQNLIAVLLNGRGRVVPGPIPPYFWAYDDSLATELYDPAQAATLLQQAGWEDHDGDGVRDRRGQALAFTMKTNADNKMRSDALVMIQADLQKIGVQAQPELLEFGRLVEDVLQKRDFDTVLLSWKTGYSVNPSQVWHSEAIADGYNLTSYHNPRVDSLLVAGRQENDRERSRRIWRAFQRLVAADCPYVFLYMQENPAVVHQRLQQVKMDVRGYLINVEEWTLAAPAP